MTPIEIIIKHLKEFVENPHPNFNNFPVCPFAHNAKINFQIYEFSLLDENLKTIILDFLNDENYEALMLISPNNITADEVEELAKQVTLWGEKHNLIAFEGHPESNFQYAGVYTRREPLPNLVVQRLTELNEAKAKLSTNYPRENIILP